MLKIDFFFGILLALFYEIPKMSCLGYANLDLSPKQQEPLSTALCPKIIPKVLWQYMPRGNEGAGIYEKKADINNIQDCLEACCLDINCNVVLMYETNCFNVKCYSNYDCEPVYRPEPKFKNARMILVSPVGSEDWGNILSDSNMDNEYSARDEDTSGMDPTYYSSSSRRCEIGGFMSCGKNEVCTSVPSPGGLSTSNVCHCIDGYYKNKTGFCVPKLGEPGLKVDLTDSSVSLAKQSSDTEQTSAKPIKPLFVSVLSKTVRLPENEVTLSAYTVPSEQNGEHYIFNWKLLEQPEGGNEGVMTEQSGGTMKLTHLIEGVYKFKVTVTAPGAYGETTTNVTVYPPNRINKPPVVIITPSSQTVKLPNTVAVLDGSNSYDDDKIVSWHWDLQSGPLNYQPVLNDSLFLQLKDLKIPGNYTFKLTVVDSNQASNSTTANITVLKLIDYPPEANAGRDVIVYLPMNNITLNGNMSTDDRGIVSWEWTKSHQDSHQEKAVDMQKTRTPYLELSNLEEGMYTFTLKVTDSSGQTSSSDVHVFVKPPTNKPPIANAGEDVVVSLPRTWVSLDASGSKGDLQINSYRWLQLSGPNKAVFTPVNSSKTNASELTKGEYEFKVIVVDSNGNSASDTVHVTVNQNENTPPTANAGGDQTIVLPVSVVLLNGSSSSDDLAITKWEWIRDGSSLALGRVVGNSDKSSVLQLIDLIPGRYVFKLKVTDGQGLSGEDTVSIIVKQDPHILQLVELTLNINGGSLTVSQEQSLKAKLALLLRNAKIHVRELKSEQNTGRAILVFYVEEQEDKTILPGPKVVSLLKEKLRQDSSLLELSVANIQTAVCQSNCSGHGTCDQSSRLCLCEAFWMQNLVRKYFGDGDSNCDWSILYVIIILFTGMCVVAGCSWGVICLIQRPFRRPRKRERYSLIDDDEETTMRVTNKSVMLSETESDSDVLFNVRDKSSQDSRNGKRPRNGFVKLGKMIKT